MREKRPERTGAPGLFSLERVREWGSAMELSKAFIQYLIDSFEMFVASAYYESLFYFILIVCVILLLLKIVRKG